jgi:hypothetical protein
MDEELELGSGVLEGISDAELGLGWGVLEAPSSGVLGGSAIAEHKGWPLGPSIAVKKKSSSAKIGPAYPDVLT